MQGKGTAPLRADAEPPVPQRVCTCKPKQRTLTVAGQGGIGVILEGGQRGLNLGLQWWKV